MTIPPGAGATVSDEAAGVAAAGTEGVEAAPATADDEPQDASRKDRAAAPAASVWRLIPFSTSRAPAWFRRAFRCRIPALNRGHPRPRVPRPAVSARTRRHARTDNPC